jgi:branched-chain amino acid transport system substrate-binding protein
MKKLFLLLLPLIVFFTGCIPVELTLRSLPEDPAAPVVIAAFLPLSGKNKVYAEQMQEGLLAAETRINRVTKVSGRKIKVEFFDTAGTAAGTREALLKAEKSPAVAAIAGYGTEEVSMLISHADRLRMPMVIPMATSDYHVQANPFVYRNCFSDTQQMEALASYLYYWRKINAGAIITDRAHDAEYTRGISRNFNQAVIDQGGSIYSTTVVEADEALSVDQLRTILMTDPKFIMLAASGKRAVIFIKQLREAGFRGVICGPDSWDDLELIAGLDGFDPGECIYTAFFNEENNSQEFLEFKKEFRKRFYHYPAACETQSFDALIFLAVALNGAEDLLVFDRQWRTIRNYHGAAARYTMLPKGDIDRTIYLKSFGVERGGKTLRPYVRIAKELQYSKLKDYRVIE